MLYDTHAHLNDEAFAEDLEEVVARAREAGVNRLNVVGYDAESSRKAVALAERFEEIYAVVGIHPSDGQDYNGDFEEQLLRWGDHPKVVAVGEIGLDYHYPDTNRELQHEVFRRQLRVGRRLNLPVVIHSRDAFEDTLRILREECGEDTHKGVFHCFSGSWEQAQVCLKLGYYLGFDGPLTFKNSRKLPQIVAAMMGERLLIETDCPYLAPEPKRGRRNEPSYVRHIAARVAAIRGISPAEAETMSWENAMRLFHAR